MRLTACLVLREAAGSRSLPVLALGVAGATAGAAAFGPSSNQANLLLIPLLSVPPCPPTHTHATRAGRCPTPPANSDAPCDPCGRRSDGNWAHAHCRGNSRGWGESGDLAPIGNVTNMHITDVDIDGPVPR